MAYCKAILLVILVLPFTARGGEAQTVKVREATEAIEDILRIPEKSIPPSLLWRANALAIIPNVIKVGFMVGGRFGRGIVLVRDKNTGRWSNPVFLNLAGGSFGFQIGAQAADIVLVFMNKRGLDSLVNGKFTLGADAAVAAGPVGRHASAATDIQFKSEILSYSRSRGLFAGVALDGSVLDIDGPANASFYGRPNVTATDIFNGRVETRAVVRPLHGLLNKYVRRRS